MPQPHTVEKTTTTSPQPVWPRIVRFQAEAAAPVTGVTDMLQLPPRACLRADRAGLFWAQHQVPIAGTPPTAGERLRVRDVLQPAWAVQTTFSASCQAVVRRRPDLVSSHITPHKDGMLVCGFARAEDGAFIARVIF